jgi:Protein of unknown function (DUF2934)
MWCARFLSRIRHQRTSPTDSFSKGVQACHPMPMSDRELALAMRELRDAPFPQDASKGSRVLRSKRSDSAAREGWISHHDGGKDCMDSNDNLVRQRAFELWDQAGKPEGLEMDFWLQAERDVGSVRGDYMARVRPTDSNREPSL